MARTNPHKVNAVIPEDPDPGEIKVHVDDAHEYVNDRLPLSEIQSGTLERIERFLAAHRYKFLQNRSLEEFERNSASGSFSGAFGEGLKATPWGQQALEEDPSGELARQGSQSVWLKSY